jgi:hypothetical protein
VTVRVDGVIAQVDDAQQALEQVRVPGQPIERGRHRVVAAPPAREPAMAVVRAGAPSTLTTIRTPSKSKSFSSASLSPTLLVCNVGPEPMTFTLQEACCRASSPQLNDCGFRPPRARPDPRHSPLRTRVVMLAPTTHSSRHFASPVLGPTARAQPAQVRPPKLYRKLSQPIELPGWRSMRGGLPLGRIPCSQFGHFHRPATHINTIARSFIEKVSCLVHVLH